MMYNMSTNQSESIKKVKTMTPKNFLRLS